MLDRIFLAAMLCLVSAPVAAECIDDIRAVYRQTGDTVNMRTFAETEIAGEVVQRTNGWYKSFGHNMYEVVDRNWWSMSLDGAQFNSTDGKNWTKSAERDPDWEEKARAESENLLENMIEPECLGMEDFQGKTYEVYRYRFVTTVPTPNDAVTTIYYDRGANFIFRTITEWQEGGGGRMIQTSTRDNTFELPNPEG